MECVIDENLYNRITEKSIDTDTLEIYIDTFNVKEKIAEELELNEWVVDMLSFSIKKDTRSDIDKVSNELENLFDEDLRKLYSQGYEEIVRLL